MNTTNLNSLYVAASILIIVAYFVYYVVLR
jgi:hypothetical protein